MYDPKKIFDLDPKSKIEFLKKAIAYLEMDLASEIAKQGAKIRFGIEKGRIVFETEIMRRHAELRTSLWNDIKNARIAVVLTAPIIYSGIIVFAALDLFVTVYQHICFPIYGIPKAKRSDYLIFDREHLAYLNILKMLNCGYCSYGNGVIAYAREIAGRTEAYWCPIKHAKKVVGAHDHYEGFAEFGDAEDFAKIYMKARAENAKTAQRE